MKKRILAVTVSLVGISAVVMAESRREEKSSGAKCECSAFPGNWAGIVLFREIQSNQWGGGLDALKKFPLDARGPSDDEFNQAKNQCEQTLKILRALEICSAD